MLFLPFLDRTCMDKTQTIVFVVVDYLAIMSFVGLLIFGCYNYYRFLLKANPRRKLTDPLSMFYLVAICVTILRIFTFVYMAKLHIAYEIVLRFLPGLFQLNLGLI